MVQAHMCSNEYYFSEIYHYIILVVLYSELNFKSQRNRYGVNAATTVSDSIYIGAEVGNRYNNMMYVHYKKKSAKSQQER